MAKKKKCKVCPTKFDPFNSLQQTCGAKCAIILAARQKSAKAKQQKKADKKKEEMSPNSKHYKTKADNIFMAQFHGLPCEVCGNTHATCGHHIVAKSRSKALRYDKRNIIVVDQEHHTMGNDMAPHSMNQLAQERFTTWFRETFPERHAWVVENERIQRRYTHKDAIENMKAGREAWEFE